MSKKSNSIPVHPMIADFGAGVFVGRFASTDIHLHERMEEVDKIKQSHRDEYHFFLLLEKGTVQVEIDFQKHTIKPLSVIFIHQNQVHRTISYKNATVSIWALSNENVQPEYLSLLDDIAPAKPLTLKKETFSLFSEAVSWGIKMSERTHEKLYHSLLNGCCNTLIGLVVSEYLAHTQATDKLTRFEMVTKAFRKRLEQDFTIAKKPSVYARLLNISVAYLNECVKTTTGYPVSHHIQQRVILEAKRLLYHSNQSVKEIATELGYDDYPYFSRLFTKVAGISALAFRKKNRD